MALGAFVRSNGELITRHLVNRDMPTFVEAKDTSKAAPTGADLPLTPEELRRESDPEDWEKTDRLFRFPGWHHSMRRRSDDPRMQALGADPARDRWLQEHDIHTEFVDAGIGCCWFAQLGDKEPVTGETEDDAIRRLARENGFMPWNGGTRS